MNKQQFEKLDEKHKFLFVNTQNPKITKTLSVTKKDRELFGQSFYTYRLDNGWGYLKAETPEQLKQLKESNERIYK